jgi:ribose 5-phosphate isomerase B
MKIAVGSDHAGFELKQRLVAYLVEGGHEVLDLGVASPERSDYPDQAAAVARSVVAGDAARGLLVCGTGVGMAIAANKVRGVRAANCDDLFVARLARAHNDANVLALGARVVGPGLAEAILEAFLGTPFEGGRHAARVGKIGGLEG